MRAEEIQASLFVDVQRPDSMPVQPVYVVGVGGAGCKAASEIRRRAVPGVGVVCVDTDGISLDRSICDEKVLLGAATMRGFGSGGDSGAVAEVAREQARRLTDLTGAATCVIVVAGLGGGTGSGAAPVIAEAVKAPGSLVVGIPIMPLDIEPISVHLSAADWLDRLRNVCDAVVEFPHPDESIANQKGAGLHGTLEAERRQISSLIATVSTIVRSGPQRCDANAGDLRSVLSDGAYAVSGTGTGFGHTGAAEAAQSCLDAAFPVAEQIPVISRAVVLVESGPEIPLSHVATVTALVEARIGTSPALHVAVHRSRLLGGSVRVSLIGSLQETRQPLSGEPNVATSSGSGYLVFPGPAAVLAS